MTHRGVLDQEAAYLEKPIRPATLLQTVHDVLSGGEERISQSAP